MLKITAILFFTAGIISCTTISPATMTNHKSVVDLTYKPVDRVAPILTESESLVYQPVFLQDNESPTAQMWIESLKQL